MSHQQLIYIAFGVAGIVIALLIVLIWKGFAFIKGNILIWIVPAAFAIIGGFLTSSPYFISGVMLVGCGIAVFACINQIRS